MHQGGCIITGPLSGPRDGRRSGVAKCCAILTLLAILALMLALAPRAEALGGSIAGTVRDTQSQPVPGVEVTMYTPSLGGVCVAQIRTDANGEYLVSGLAAGTYKLRFYLFGWVTTFYRDAPWPEPATPVILGSRAAADWSRACGGWAGPDGPRYHH